METQIIQKPQIMNIGWLKSYNISPQADKDKVH